MYVDVVFLVFVCWTTRRRVQPSSKSNADKFAYFSFHVGLTGNLRHWRRLFRFSEDVAFLPPSHHSQIQSERWSLWLGVHSLWKKMCVYVRRWSVTGRNLCRSRNTQTSLVLLTPLMRCMCRTERQNVAFVITSELHSSADGCECGGRWGRERKRTGFWWNLPQCWITRILRLRD